METWKPIPNFENEYEVSSLGNIRSIDRYVNHYIKNAKRLYKGKQKALRFDKDGYLRCTLKKDGKKFNFRVNRLVAIAFIKNSDNKNIVNHINGIKSDNRIENLEWVTNSENIIHAVKNRFIKTSLTDEEAIEIFNSRLSNRKLGIIYNINSTIVWRIKNKKAYRHLWQQHYL